MKANARGFNQAKMTCLWAVGATAAINGGPFGPQNIPAGAAFSIALAIDIARLATTRKCSASWRAYLIMAELVGGIIGIILLATH